ncbi:MAG: FG-GAP-like repeat-containing protein [Actinomycetota bacterium]
MRRFPAIGLAVLLLSCPVAAHAAVPDPRVEGSMVGGIGPSTIATAIGDVTGDAVADLIVARGADAGAEAYTVAVFAGPLTGALPTTPTFVVTPSVASDAYRLAVGDLNHDGLGDLAVAAVDGVDTLGAPQPGIDIFFESGGALPATPDQAMTPIPLLDLAIADMNGDDFDDLVFTRTASTRVELRLRTQNNDGSFAAGVVVEADAPATGVSIGDVNHDGLHDVALDGLMTGAVPAYVQSAIDHSFTRTDVTLPVEITGVSGAVLSDVDGDTNDDVLVVTNTDALAWALADGNGGFGSFSTATSAVSFSAKEVGDLNGDGLADLATFGADGLVRIYLQQDVGGLGPACVFPAAVTLGDDAATAIGDVTGDGAIDLVEADGTSSSGGASLYRQLTGTDRLPTSIDAAATRTTMQVGKSVKFSGTFSNPDGGCLRNGSVTLTRSGPGGSVPNDVAFGSDGSFAFTDTPSASGTYDYVVSFAGDETHEISQSTTMSVKVTKIPTSLRLKATHPRIAFGDTTTLRATLTGGQPSSDVVFEVASSGTWKSIDTVQLGADGVATLKVQPSAKTRYRAEFLVTPTMAASVSAAVTVQVHAVMISRMIGKGVQDGRYRVYACCTAYFYAKLRPLHPNVKWTATVQYYGNGRWRPLGSGTYPMERDGDAAIYLNASQGYRYRVKASFAGDADHLGATGAWRYFRFR